MEAKDKARELFDYYYTLLPYAHTVAERAQIAKNGALYFVKQIILEREVIYSSLGFPVGSFWSEVESELKNI